MRTTDRSPSFVSVNAFEVGFEGDAVDWPPGGEPLDGAPAARDHVLTSGAVEAGIWECTPGSWQTKVAGYSELMHFVAGRGTIVASDGSAIDIAPGVVLFVEDGWEATWLIQETVRKSYCIVRSVPASR